MSEGITQKFINKLHEIGFACSRATGCWLWLGPISMKGYGVLWIKNKALLAHRIAIAANGGTVPDGYVIDHLCRNKLCINPQHLDICTTKENTHRGLKGKRWEIKKCIRGHEFTEANSRIIGRRRHCRTCEKNFWRNHNDPI